MVYRDQDVVIYENSQAMPRVYLAAAAVERGGLGAVEQLQREPLDPRRTAIVDLPEAVAPGVGDGGAIGSAEIISYEPNRVVARVSAETDALLVLADRYDDNWRVSVDEAERRLLRANGMFRAVQVPAGTHTVVFQYRPLSLPVGLAISLVAAVVSLAAALACSRSAVVGWLRRRPAASPCGRPHR
jgi:hypothetical protein